MSDRLRFASICPWVPVPDQTGHTIRFGRLKSALARHAELELFCFCWEDELARVEASEWLRQTFHERHIYPVQVDRRVPPLWVPLFAALDGVAVKLVRDLRVRHKARPFDAVIANHSFSALLVRSLGIPILADEHNIDSHGLEQSLTGDAQLVDDRSTAMIAGQRQLERTAWTSVSLVTCVGEHEANLIRPFRVGPIEVIPNGADVSMIPYIPPSARSAGDVLYVGTMSHRPNARAAQFLAERVMPIVRATMPDARLTLCGGSPGPEVRALASPWCEVTGSVPDIRVFQKRASVFANALFHGAGSSLKVPEALAAGLPMISTNTGVRGYELRAGEDFIAAETADEFATAIVDVLRAPAKFDARAAAARRRVEALDWTRIGERFADLACSLVSR